MIKNKNEDKLKEKKKGFFQRMKKCASEEKGIQQRHKQEGTYSKKMK